MLSAELLLVLAAGVVGSGDGAGVGDSLATVAVAGVAEEGVAGVPAQPEGSGLGAARVAASPGVGGLVGVSPSEPLFFSES